jgi:hypothetical protein
MTIDRRESPQTDGCGNNGNPQKHFDARISVTLGKRRVAMKLQTIKRSYTSKPFLLITLSLLIVAPLCSGACVTPRAMDYAKSKASPSNVAHFTIGKVYSAMINENSDISILVELDHPNHPKSGLYTMTVPLPCLAGKADAIGSFGFREAYTLSVSGLPSYSYPMAKARKSSGDIVSKDFSNSSIPIEELNLHQDEAERVFELLGDLNRDPPGGEKVYVINLLSDEATKALQEDSGKTVEERATIDKTTLLVYWPLMSSSSLPQPIAIAGAYEDESSNLYYLLVPPAIAVDSFLIALAVAAYASLGVLGIHY